MKETQVAPLEPKTRRTSGIENDIIIKGSISMASRTSPNNRLQDRHKPNTNFHLLTVVVEDERKSAAGAGTPAGSGIADKEQVADWRNIRVWASAGCILVVVGVDCNEPA